MENENTYKYGAGSYQEQNLDIQREHERQARQREEDAQRCMMKRCADWKVKKPPILKHVENRTKLNVVQKHKILTAAL